MQFKFAFMKLRSFGKCRRRRPADGGGLGARRWWAFVAHLVQLLVLGSGEDRLDVSGSVSPSLQRHGRLPADPSPPSQEPHRMTTGHCCVVIPL